MGIEVNTSVSTEKNVMVTEPELTTEETKVQNQCAEAGETELGTEEKDAKAEKVGGDQSDSIPKKIGIEVNTAVSTEKNVMVTELGLTTEETEVQNQRAEASETELGTEEKDAEAEEVAYNQSDSIPELTMEETEEEFNELKIIAPKKNLQILTEKRSLKFKESEMTAHETEQTKKNEFEGFDGEDVSLELLNFKLKRSLSKNNPNFSTCIDVLNEISTLKLTQCLLRKNSDFMRTIKTIGKYKLNESVREKAIILFKKLQSILLCKDSLNIEEVEDVMDDIDNDVDVESSLVKDFSSSGDDNDDDVKEVGDVLEDMDVEVQGNLVKDVSSSEDDNGSVGEVEDVMTNMDSDVDPESSSVKDVSSSEECNDNVEGEHRGRQRKKNETNSRYKEMMQKIDCRDSRQKIEMKTKYPNITVPQYCKKNDGRRMYNRKNVCYFCETVLHGKMPRHYKKQHPNEPLVARILAYTNKEQQRLAFEKLRYMGDFNYNMTIFEKGKGELIVARRPLKPKPCENYLPCTFCYGFIEISEIWAHAKRCKHSKKKEDENEDFKEIKSYISQCRMLLHGGNIYGAKDTLSHKRVLKVIVSTMRERENENIKKTVANDDLILHFGGVLLERKGEKKKNEISAKMRQLGRLVLTIRQILGKDVGLEKCIHGKHFDTVVSATQHLCVPQKAKTMHGVQTTKSPSLGLHLGHSLIKCCHIKHGKAIRMGDLTMQKDAENFRDLFRQEWTDTISSPALQVLKEREYTKKESLPTTEDLKKLHEYTNSCLDVECKKLKSDPCEANWRALTKTIFVLVTVFNKRRGGEVSRIRVSCFTDRQKSNEGVHKDLMESLSSMEQQLAKRFDCMKLPGKRNRKVPMLIKREWVQPMELLVETREACNVLPENDYFFAVPKTLTYINAWQTLNNYVSNAGCESAVDISTTRLRKYTATMLQVLALTKGELQWLSNHLGHELSIHLDVYRQHSGVIEAGKISKLLLAMENGRIKEVKGKNLSEINENDICMFNNADEDNEEEEDIPQPRESSHESDISSDNDIPTISKVNHKPRKTQAEESESSSVSDIQTSKFKRTIVKRKKRVEESSDSDIQTSKSKRTIAKRKKRVEESESSSDSDIQTSKSKQTIVKRKKRVEGKTYVRKRWSQEEKEIFNQKLAKYLKVKKCPPTESLKTVVKMLPDRTLAQVRTRVNNIILGKQDL
ncbi:uncharacterized protein LOC117103757 isoform X3 [Anneissia japonica]|uniref:uncharacterized protein LOC117103757 isoform X3 n=1 Tax=Anneissia japonica TaxID=1529436 RepID=UPI001425812E|nr:uncharacterized protein LOC117103757 isoform X3 [Anneissia japonica]